MIGERFDAAVGLARRLHGDQTRKGTSIPYLSHLLAVTALVLEDGADEDLAIAALLHDAAEDAGGERVLDEIRERFGERVAGIVRGCSDSLVDTRVAEKEPWVERKKRYLDGLGTASDDVLRVAAADKLHNARSILADLRVLGAGVWGRFSMKDPQMHLWYFEAVVSVLRERLGGRTVEQLARTHAEIERLVQGVPGGGTSTGIDTPVEESPSDRLARRIIDPPPGRPGFLERWLLGRRGR